MDLIQELNDFLISDKVELKLPPLSLDDRKVVHEWCEKHKINSFSTGVEPYRYMVINKSVRKAYLSESNCKEFIKETKLPIPIVKPPHLDYYLDLYEKEYRARSKYNELIELVRDIETKHNTSFKSYKMNLLKTITQDLKDTDAYKKFQAEKTVSSVTIDLPQFNIYRQKFGEKDWFISLDIIKANYSSYQRYKPDIIFGTESWNEFMGKYTEYDYFINSKSFRQIIFGHLNMKKNESLWKQMTHNLYSLLAQKMDLNIVGKISDDELIIQTSKDTIDTDLEIIENTLKLLDNGDGKYWKITPYSVKGFARTSTYKLFHLTTNYYTNEQEIKGCDKELFAQIYKKFRGLEPHPYDTKAMLGDMIVTFDDPLDITMC